MKDGFIRVGAASPAVSVADCRKNADTLIAAARRAAEAGVRVLVFPELSLTAYTCGDLFFQPLLIRETEEALARYIRRTAALDMLSFVGLPVLHGGRLYNAVAAVSRGRLLAVVPKTHLPNHAEFYEPRHFSAAPEELETLTLCGQTVPFGTRLLFPCDEMPSLVVAAEICEDLWVPAPPSSAHTAAGATLIVNASASNEIVGKDERRRMLVCSQSSRTLSAYVYADAAEGESGTDTVFAGHDLIVSNGRVLAERAPFAKDELIFTEVDLSLLLSERAKNSTYPHGGAGYTSIPFSLTPVHTSFSRRPDPAPFTPADPASLVARCEQILSIQAEGLAGRTVRAHASTLVLGVSGGLDSTLALLVCVRAMERLSRPLSDIIAVTMPCFGTTARTRGNAELLCDALGVSLRTVDIHGAVRGHFADIGHDENERNAVYENAQARERTQILMDLANATGGLVVGTGDLSELALGWATYNGDHMSMYGVNAALPKTLVRHVVAHAAAAYEAADRAEAGAVLRDILATPVSPELLPPTDGEIAQQTEGIVGPYELHDFFLYHFVRHGFTPGKILRIAEAAFEGVYEGAVIAAWLRIFLSRFFTQQFKRSCLPDGPKIGSVSLSPRGDWRMPSDATAALWLDELDEIMRERGWR